MIESVRADSWESWELRVDSIQILAYVDCLNADGKYRILPALGPAIGRDDEEQKFEYVRR